MRETRWDAGWKPTGMAGLFQGARIRLRKRHVQWACCLSVTAYLIALGMATHWPPHLFPRLPWRVHLSDKVAHFGAYALLVTLVVVTAISFGALQRWRAVQWIGLACGGLLLLAVLGWCDEWTQPFVGRQFDWFDWAADLAGAATAAVLAAIYLPMQKRLKMRSRISSV